MPRTVAAVSPRPCWPACWRLPAAPRPTGSCSRCARTTGGARVLRPQRLHRDRPATPVLRRRCHRGGAAARRNSGHGHNGAVTTPSTSAPLVLGIETSCDETGVGIVRGHTLLADAVASSVEEHARFGGVVPEVASRAHLEAMVPTIQRACETAGVSLTDVDAIAVTAGPGLAGALLVGVAAAKSLALGLDKPLYGVNHLAAHVAVDQLEHGALPDPCLAMLVSGGHSSLLRVGDVTASVEPLGVHHRRRRGGGLRQGGPAARPAVPRRSAHRPRRPLRLVGRHRLPARAVLAARPRAAPLRLLLLRAQDRRRPVGAGV